MDGFLNGPYIMSLVCAQGNEITERKDICKSCQNLLLVLSFHILPKNFNPHAK